MNKKFLIVMITFLLTMSNVVFANGTKINDIEKSSSYATYSIQYLAGLKVISGDDYHYNAHSSLLYKNIGKQPYIVAPPATAIKNVKN